MGYFPKETQSSCTIQPLAVHPVTLKLSDLAAAQWNSSVIKLVSTKGPSSCLYGISSAANRAKAPVMPVHLTDRLHMLS